MLSDSIDALVNATLTIRRTTDGGYVDGIKQPGTSSTYTCDVVMQPAFGLNRVVGGSDLHGMVDNQHVTTVYDFFTRTEIKEREPGFEPDVVVGYKGADWTVARVEEWPDLDGGHYYRAIITKITRGAS